MQDKIFYTVCFGFVFGVFARSFLVINLYFVILLGLIALALVFFFAFISKANLGILVSVFLFTFSIGIFRFDMVDVSRPAFFESQVEREVSLSGEIIDEPTVGENNQKLTVEINDTNSAMAGNVSVRVLLSAELEEDYKYGDQINFEGKLKKPVNFITDQGKVFDYVNYLRKDGILYVMNYPEIDITSRDNGNSLREFLFFVKEKFLEKIDFYISTPESLLLGGLILGEKSQFSEELRESFVNTGTIHIVALSGYNVMIVADWIMGFFSFLPFYFSIGLGIFAIFLFILMTGASSTSVRAGIMAILALVARATGRSYDVARALVLACVLMIIFNPFVLVFDVSFELSVLATFAIIFITPRIEKYFTFIPRKFGLRNTISATIATYVFVLPFILYKMGNLSLVAMPANVFVLPFIPLTMAFGFLTGFLGLIFYMFAIPFGYISYIFLHYELGVVGFFSGLPFASLAFPNFPLWLMVLIYAYFIYKLFGRNMKGEQQAQKF